MGDTYQTPKQQQQIKDSVAPTNPVTTATTH